MYDFVDRNGLLVLMGPNEEAKFRKLVARMPETSASRWNRLLAGQVEGSAFAEAVRQEEDRLAREARAGRNRALATIAGALAFVAVLGVLYATLLRGGDDDEAVGRIFFGVQETKDGPKLIEGDAPAVNRNLYVRLESTMGVASGSQPEAERVRTEIDAALLPHAPGALSATLFQFGGRGQVVIAGPAGFAERACLQVSAVALNLRPFDTVRFEGAPGACPASVVGRNAQIGCRGDTAIMLELQFPEGQVDLEEGGSATIGGVRILSFANAAGFDSVSVRGSIGVAAGKAESVPRFGGSIGEAVAFDMTPEGAQEPIFGRCTLR